MTPAEREFLNSCGAYAINLSIDDKKLLIKRFSGEKYKVIHYALTSKHLDEIGDEEWQITDTNKFKIYLNNLFGVSFSEIADDSENNKGNPSYRDLVAFNFQTQSIVANPNCLLYKMDLADYRFYLRRIFDYAIGAITSEQLYAGLKKQELVEKLKDLQRQKNKHEIYIQRKIETAEPLLYKAIEYGLIPQTEINISDTVNIEILLKQISEKNIGDIKFSDEANEVIANKIQNLISQLEKNDLDQQIEEINSEIAKYDFNIDDLRQKQLTSIINKSNSYVPSFAEFDEIASFSKDDLTIKVKNKYSSESYFLWETGSGSNWVAYHIATMLGLHKHFIYKKTPVFNFIIFDQPSQVYFPKINYQHVKDFNFDNEKKSNNVDKGFSDLECVQEMFKIMSKAINDNKPKKVVVKVDKDGIEHQTEEILDSNLQIIVLDHAGPDVWENQEGINDINPLNEWTLDNRLVPKSWINE